MQPPSCPPKFLKRWFGKQRKTFAFWSLGKNRSILPPFCTDPKQQDSSAGPLCCDWPEDVYPLYPLPRCREAEFNFVSHYLSKEALQASIHRVDGSSWLCTHTLFYMSQVVVVKVEEAGFALVCNPCLGLCCQPRLGYTLLWLINHGGWRRKGSVCSMCCTLSGS